MSTVFKPKLLIYCAIGSEEEALHWREEYIGNMRVAPNAAVRLFILV